MKWSAWSVAHYMRETFYASRMAFDPSKEGESRYTFQKDRRRYRSREAAQRRADELNGSPASPAR